MGLTKEGDRDDGQTHMYLWTRHYMCTFLLHVATSHPKDANVHRFLTIGIAPIAQIVVTHSQLPFQGKNQSRIQEIGDPGHK